MIALAQRGHHMATSPSSATDDEVREQLESIIRAAEEKGVSVEGGYQIRTDDPNRRDWEVQIFELQK